MCGVSRVTERKPYPSDLTDTQWALIEPVLTTWKAAHPSVSGHEGNYELREIVNAIRYQGRAGVQWDYLPHDLPPKSATYYYFSKWRDDGTDKTIHDLLRWHLREKKKRLADPSLVVLDTQSVHVAAGVPASTTGKDAAKRVPGRKRGLAVDVEIVERNPADKGFVPQRKRWVVEQTYGILMFHRRLVRDYEHLPASSESRVYWAMTDVMSRRLTRGTAPSRRWT
jgi:transposase